MLKTLVTHPRVPLSRDRLMEASHAGGKGSGLGLAIVERAARMHCGNVKLLGREGDALEARVELPVVVPKMAQAHHFNGQARIVS